MSYLGALRLHFAGQFQSNVSTVNNDPAHFDNAIFKPGYQAMEGKHMRPPNGWFNPQGDAAFRLLGCTIGSAWMPSGQVPASDPVLGYIVADSDGQVPGKMVDLDPEQQLVSEIWGLQVRIADSGGNTLMSGSFEPAAFMDIWDRATGGGSGDIGAGATYQSILTGLEWGDVSASPFLTALQQAASGGTLSIKMNVDGLNMDFTSPHFMCGRIAGTIGPSGTDEPQHMVIGRQFMASAAAGGNFFTPQGKLNFFPAVVDAAAGCIYLDLGNALSTANPGGPINNHGDLTLSVGGTGLGTIPAAGDGGYASDPDWYARTAGVVALPLTADQLQAIAAAPLTLAGTDGATISEWSNGAFLRADRYVYRLSPGDDPQIPVYATQFGKPLVGASVAFVLDSSQLQPTTAQFPYIAAGPAVAEPDTALSFDSPEPTDANGVALLSIKATDPGTPRWFNNGADYGIDGQVYGIRPSFADAAMNVGPVNQWSFVSFLLWSGYTPANPVTWTDVQPIFQQYANLYPVMLRFLNLADYKSVLASSGQLSLAFGLDVADPNSMPVTRDLSPAKRAAILTWLKAPWPGEVPAPSPRTEQASLKAEAFAESQASAPPRGGKAAAAARRLVLQAR
jgi:hypothetical protein